MSMVTFKRTHLLEGHVQKAQLAEQTTLHIRKSGFLNWSLSPLHLLLLSYAFGPLRRLLFKSTVFQPLSSQLAVSMLCSPVYQNTEENMLCATVQSAESWKEKHLCIMTNPRTGTGFQCSIHATRLCLHCHFWSCWNCWVNLVKKMENTWQIL